MLKTAEEETAESMAIQQYYRNIHLCLTCIIKISQAECPDRVLNTIRCLDKEGDSLTAAMQGARQAHLEQLRKQVWEHAAKAQKNMEKQ